MISRLPVSASYQNAIRFSLPRVPREKFTFEFMNIWHPLSLMTSHYTLPTPLNFLPQTFWGRKTRFGIHLWKYITPIGLWWWWGGKDGEGEVFVEESKSIELDADTHNKEELSASSLFLCQSSNIPSKNPTLIPIPIPKSQRVSQ
jgi:hypothetical protein